MNPREKEEGGSLPRSARVRSRSERVVTLGPPPTPTPSPSRTAVPKPCAPSPLTPDRRMKGSSVGERGVYEG